MRKQTSASKNSDGPPALRFILVRPRNPDNIGAAARAMANFGLTDLVLVNAFESDWKEASDAWRREASVSAIGAMDIISSARLCGSVAEAAEGCALLLGTSSLHRIRPERDVVTLAQAPALIAAAGGRTGLLFGTEKTGLTKEDLSLCSAVVNIPTAAAQPSMNLGQAVAVASYELSGRRDAPPSAGRRDAPAASPAEIERMTLLICGTLAAEAGPHWAGEAQLRAVRQGLTDARLTKDAMSALKLLLKGRGEKRERPG